MITPMNGYVLLKKYVKPAKQGVIIMPDAEKPKNLGIVEYSDNEAIRCGSIVQYGKYAAVEVEDHPDLMLVKEQDILAVHGTQEC